MSLSLDQLFEQAKERAKQAPEDLAARSALWQIFAARGEFDRARRQLDMMPRIDGTWEIEVQACHKLIDTEEQRPHVFLGKRAPLCLGTPPDWFGKLAAALQMLGEGGRDPALRLLAEVWESGDARCATLNGQRIDWVRDGDVRVGCCLELIIQGHYYWAPWDAIRKIETQPPSEVRDRLWQPATVHVTDEGGIEAFIPVRYPAARNGEEALASTTVWEEAGPDQFFGFGQKALVTSSESVGYLDIRDLSFEATASAE